MSESRTLVLHGDSQAEAIALILRSLEPVNRRYAVVYTPEEDGGHVSAEVLASCDLFCEQRRASAGKAAVKLPKHVRRLSFPTLELHLLWPFYCVNPFNRPEPPKFPFGKFPYGDNFIINCIKRGTPADQIIEYYRPDRWPATWPNLDAIFQIETMRLSSQDAVNDVKVGAFILKYFRRIRLFWALNAPSNHLLAETVYRLLHAAFGSDEVCGREEIRKTLASFGPRDLLAGASVPIHPLVAGHFNLQWYKRDERCGFVGDRELTFDEYFSEMISTASEFHPKTRKDAHA